MRRDVFQAIADPVRREIIGMLASEQLNLNSIAGRFEISRPAISKHIKILNECGLVAVQKQGRERICSIRAAKLTEVADWVEQFRTLWENRLDSLEAYLELIQQKSKHMNDNSNQDKLVVTMTRTFKAPRKLVWETWTKAEHIAAWWGPKGMETRVDELDFRPGGNWKYVMVGPNGSEFVTHGTFSEIVEFEKIVTTGEFAQVTQGVVLTIELEEVGEETQMTFSVWHPTEEYKQQQQDMGFEKGWGSTFDGLANYLSTLAG